ncbi:hypothetical protein E1258_12140 [Micromonospora sp. KC207]|nr:hypothetical protein E1258_12140 [Micromonospora sp. KC207]
MTEIAEYSQVVVRGQSLCCYLDVSLPEMLRRHLTRPQTSESTAEQMSGWYADRDGHMVDWGGNRTLVKGAREALHAAPVRESVTDRTYQLRYRRPPCGTARRQPTRSSSCTR